MQSHPIPASKFVQMSEVAKKLLLDHGGIPYNDIFLPLWNCIANIILAYGSYGSSKSVSFGLYLLKSARENPYFKCLYGRKVKNDIRESCFSTLCDLIEDNNWQGEFSYSRKDNSSMHILHRNGNVFIPFGSDDPNKIKSVRDPSHIWAEELDQFNQDDFGILYSRLRTLKAKCQFLGSFNTDKVLESHWIRKLFFPESLTRIDQINAEEEMAELRAIVKDILKIKANYTDNFFIDQEAYYDRLVMAAAGNKRILDATARGEWGASENKSPWLYAFDYDKHVADVQFIPSFPIYLSFDFNRDPCTCTLWQFSPSKGLRDERTNVF